MTPRRLIEGTFSMKIRNPFESPGRWRKANLHTHTTTSDGNKPPAERAAQYREAGYAVLALTDHEATNDVTNLSSDDFLVLSGMETHPDCPGSAIPYHVVCLNVPHGMRCEGDVNARIRQVKDAGGEAFVAHPYWCGFDVNHLLPVEGAIGLEVFNTTCCGCGKGFSSVHWDNLLERGEIVPALAVDDVHHPHDVFQGWTMIKAEDLTVEAIMEALRTGAYYSSCGPEIFEARLVDGTVRVECSPASEIHFIAQGPFGRSVYTDGDGRRGRCSPIASAEFALSGEQKYVRVEIVDAHGRRAWTNPMIPGGNGS
ncbi:MAG TPA: CehA/McbA family metallohydrolase [Sumerlaeia bacterium]|nr:CehA/McbA family metallohydrolase [Sumerlaeia bacterium]